MKKLTKPQMVILEELMESSRSYSPSYTPIQRLEQMGLIKGRDRKWGSRSYEITDAGRAALQDLGTRRA